jgi:cytochrome c553
MTTMKSMTQFFFAALTSAVMAGSVFAATPAPKAEKPDLAKGEAIVGGVCAACHMADGNSSTPVNPKLAQQHPEYIIKQLQEYKSGKRANAVMMGFASQLSDADMRNVAYFLASKRPSPDSPKKKSLLPWVKRFTAVVLPTVKLQLALAATAQMVQACLRNTPVCRDNMLNTPPANSPISVTVFAKIICK